MDEEAETKAIEKCLRMVDKPLTTKEKDKKMRSQEKNEAMPTSRSFCAAAGCEELRRGKL